MLLCWTSVVNVILCIMEFCYDFDKDNLKTWPSTAAKWTWVYWGYPQRTADHMKPHAQRYMMGIWRGNQKAGYIIVWESRGEGCIFSKCAGIKCLCFPSRQSWLLSLFKEPEHHITEPWHTKLAFTIHLEISNQTLIIATTCEREGYGVLLICCLMIAAGYPPNPVSEP